MNEELKPYVFQEYPKWIYPAGIKEAYEPGEEPYLVQSADEIAEPVAEQKRRGRPAKVVKAE